MSVSMSVNMDMSLSLSLSLSLNMNINMSVARCGEDSYTVLHCRPSLSKFDADTPELETRVACLDGMGWDGMGFCQRVLEVSRWRR